MMLTPAVEKLLEDFNCLSTQERQMALLEVLRRSRDYSMDPVMDDELNSLAEELFQTLDREEQIENSAAG